jgi:hypothetical protein
VIVCLLLAILLLELDSRLESRARGLLPAISIGLTVLAFLFLLPPYFTSLKPAKPHSDEGG